MSIRRSRELLVKYRKEYKNRTFNTEQEITEITNYINQRVVEEALKNNPVSLTGLGVFRVRKKLRINASIDWGTTNKLKKEILARGGTLYKQWEEDGKIVNNGGEEYLAYYTDNHYFKFELGVHSNYFYNKDNVSYKFEASRNGARPLLIKAIKTTNLKYIL